MKRIRKKFLFSLIAFILGMGGALYASLYFHSLYLRSHNPKSTALMHLRGGKTVQKWVPLNQISPWLQKAVIASEDFNFYSHSGIDLYELKESMKKNIKKRRWARGGSTITMQLAKNLYLTPDKNIFRKVVEMIIAKRLEQSLPKKRILELYLNLIEWGEGVYGAEAAAAYYFQKSASALTAEESSWLAAVIPSPRKYPKPAYASYIDQRKRIILRRIGGERDRPVETVPTLEEFLWGTDEGWEEMDETQEDWIDPETEPN